MPPNNVTTLVRQLQDWAWNSANERYYRDGQLQQIENALADPRRTTQLAIATWLVGTWHLGSGQARVLDGDGAAWDDVRTGAALLRQSLLLRASRSRRHTRHGDVPDLPPLHVAHGAALALSLGDPDAEPLLAACAALPDAFFGDGDAYPLFVRELVRVRAGARPNASPRLGDYASVFLHWTGDEALLARRLADLLDLHLQETAPRGTFAEPGVRLYPAEVLAVRSVRTDLELPMPKVEHELLHTNLAWMQPRGPWPRDPLVARLQRELDRA